MGLLKRMLQVKRPPPESQDQRFTGDIRIFQITHAGAPMPAEDPEVQILDNTHSTRPDWFEYWPIRNFLLSQPLEESAVYGFLSPRFSHKTGLDSGHVLRFIESSADADVYTFSPYPCHGAFFQNVFEHGNFFDPGSLDLASWFLEGINPAVRLQDLVNHSGSLVFSNFFLAKPRFWRQWISLGEALYAAAEACPIGEGLRSVTVYQKENEPGVQLVERKVFLMERLASYILATSSDLRVLNHPIDGFPISLSASAFAPEIARMDQLKRDYTAHRDPAVLREYRSRQRQIVSGSWPAGSLDSLLDGPSV